MYSERPGGGWETTAGSFVSVLFRVFRGPPRVFACFAVLRFLAGKKVHAEARRGGEYG